MVALVVVGIILLIVIVGVLFVKLSPEFGGKATEQQQDRYAQSSNFSDGKFVNSKEVQLDMSFGTMMKTIGEYLKSHPNTVPKGSIPVDKIDSMGIVSYDSEKPRLIWFGHSAFLLQLNHKNILIDPMFGDVPAPHPLLGTSRFGKELPIAVEKLPFIDAVIFSHDHYDHLDYGSIVKLRGKVKAYYVPLGVGNHLKSWGIDSSQITELDWWQEATHDELTFRCTPAQHFSGRGLSDRASTLWSSWIIHSPKSNIYFSGDSGYGAHFKEIGEKYGPFDFAMMECGQYNENWKDIHMFPEETAQAAVDVKAKVMMPIHWGAFKLSLHSWTDPVVRLKEKAQELGMPVSTPKIGEQIILGDSIIYPKHDWWLNY